MLNSLRAITLTYNLKIKFPTPLGVDKVKDEQLLTQECDSQELRGKGQDVLTLDEMIGAVGAPLPRSLNDLDEEVQD